MKHYDDMKDSGIKWIGKIPSHWSTYTLYQLVSQVKNKNSELQEKNLLSLSYGKIKRKDIESNGGLLPASFSGYNIIETNDIVLRLTDLQNDHTSLRVGQSIERGIITSAYTTLHSINQNYSRYLYYLLHAFDLKKGFYGMGSGVRQGLNYNEVKELKVILPKIDEQNAIVSYLDKKCNDIDSLIEETKKSVEEYKKWKDSIIFEAVTKGLDKKAEMRKSRIPWLGSVPVDWLSSRIKQAVIQNEGGAWGKDANGSTNDRVCMRIADFLFEQGKFKKHKKEVYTIRNYSDAQIKKLTLSNGDILVEKSGGGEKTPVGRAVLFDLNFEALFANFMNRLKIDNSMVSSEFFCFYWRALYLKTVTTVYIKQTIGIQNLDLSSLLEKERIVFPILSIQKQIVDYLKSLDSRIEAVIKEKQELIKKLNIYKQSLIYEVVTGKRKVV